jgi:hypothetical protein
MSDYLTILPTELIHKILDDVPTLDIFLSLSLVNKRLRCASLAYPRFQPDFSCEITSIKKSSFDSICIQLLRSISQVVSLKLFEKDDPMTPAKNALFFSRFSGIDRTFLYLRSLTLTYISYDTWRLFKTRLPSLIETLSIVLDYNEKYASSSAISAILSELLLFSSSLKHLSVRIMTNFDRMVIIRPQNPFVSSSVQYLDFEGVNIDLSSVFIVAPALHTFKVRFTEPELIFDKIHPRPLYLQRLRIKLSEIVWTEMKHL